MIWESVSRRETLPVHDMRPILRPAQSPDRPHEDAQRPAALPVFALQQGLQEQVFAQIARADTSRWDSWMVGVDGGFDVCVLSR